MKYYLLILFFAISSIANSQSKQTIQILANTKLLEQTVFGTKDSLTLEKLFATTLTYEHSNGKVQSREEAIRGIVNNKSVYTKYPTLNGYEVINKGDSIVTKQVFKAIEKKADGAEAELNLSIELVWAKEQNEWKVFRRKATKIQE